VGKEKVMNTSFRSGAYCSWSIWSSSCRWCGIHVWCSHSFVSQTSQCSSSLQ